MSQSVDTWYNIIIYLLIITMNTMNVLINKQNTTNIHKTEEKS